MYTTIKSISSQLIRLNQILDLLLYFQIDLGEALLQARIPPSMVSLIPVMYFDSSEP